MDTKRQYSSINPNTIHGFLGPPETEVTAAIDSDDMNYLPITSLTRKSPIKASMTISAKGLSPVKRSHLEGKAPSKPVSQSPINERNNTENDENSDAEQLKLEIEYIRTSNS
jgi:hypothetical protein